MIKKSIISIYRFYYDGFREMTLGRTLWAIILIKLFVMFFIFVVLLFPFLLGKAKVRKRSKIMWERN